MSRKTTSKRVAFIAMVILMTVSVGLAFTVLRKPKPDPLPEMPGFALNTGTRLEQSIVLYQDLQQLELLQQEISAILAKKHLADKDSVSLKIKLKQIDSIYKRAKAH